MKLKHTKLFTILVITISIITVPIFSLAQENLDQVSDTDIEQVENLINSTIETALKEERAEGNDFNLDIVWKANTLLPYDYKGKAWPSSLSSIVFYAMADVPNPDSLVYTWLIDDISSNKEGPELQGRGKSTFNWFTFQTPEFTHELRVFAQDNDGRKGSASLNIKTVSPEINFSIINNNIFNNSIFGSLKLQPGSSTNILVRPFYFNLFNLDGLDFIWKLNGKADKNSGPRKDILPLNISSSALPGAYSNLRLELKNNKQKNNIFDSANATININIIK
ncbi:MAG: hypothetical protein Q8Q95_03835 [bacterium]|nr:hypothetical protein [bacterium]